MEELEVSQKSLDVFLGTVGTIISLENRKSCCGS